MCANVSPEHVAIVGAGMFGLATAWFLQQRGVRATVVDRVGVAAGSSWGNAGMLNPAFTVPLSDPATLRFGLKAAFSPSAPLILPTVRDHSLWTFMARLGAHCTPSRCRKAMAVFTELNRDSLRAHEELAEGGTIASARNADPLLAVCASEHDRTHLVEELDTVRANGDDVSYDLAEGDELRALDPPSVRMSAPAFASTANDSSTHPTTCAPSRVTSRRATARSSRTSRSRTWPISARPVSS